MISEIGETSNLAAMRGNTPFPNEVAPATMCVNFNWFCSETTASVIVSAVWPLNDACLANKTFDTPFNLDAFSATYSVVNSIFKMKIQKANIEWLFLDLPLHSLCQQLKQLHRRQFFERLLSHFA